LAVRTFRTLLAEARTLLQDSVPTQGGQTRNSDDELMQAVNGALAEVRTKRPDLYLPLGLRNPVPLYSASTDLDQPFPLDLSVYTPFVYYVAGRTELREDTFGNDERAVTLLNKFLTQIMTVNS
jgi:hypothetical protein